MEEPATSVISQSVTSVTASYGVATVSDKNTLAVTQAFNLSTTSIVFNNLLSAAILCLNSVCLMAMVRRRLFAESNKFIFMGSLATMNIVLGTLFIAQNSALSVDELIKDQTTFKYYTYVDMLTSQVVVTGQVYSLLLLTLDQYLRIEKPLRYPIYATRKNAWISLAAVALLCVISVIILVTFWAISGKDSRYYYGIPLWLAIVLLGVVVPVPLGLIIPMHIRILSIVWKASKTIATLQIKFTPQDLIKSSTATDSQGVSNEREPPIAQGKHRMEQKKTIRKDKNVHFLRSQWKSVVTVSVMVGFYLGCWIPVSVCAMVMVFDPNGISPKVMAGTILLYRVNFLITPLIFIVRLKEVRKEIKKMFRCQ